MIQLDPLVLPLDNDEYVAVCCDAEVVPVMSVEKKTGKGPDFGLCEETDEMLS